MSNTDNITPLIPTSSEAPAPAAKPPTLTADIAIEMSGALVRFDELRNAPILTKENEQEQALLGEFIASKLVVHARDLLAAWFIMTQEYKPLVIALAPIVNRCVDMRRSAVSTDAAK